MTGLASTARAVDVHAHLFPQSAVRAEASGAEWYGSTFEPVGPDRPPVVVSAGRRAAMGAVEHRMPPEHRLEAMAEAGVATQVISLLPPLFRYELPAETGASAARAVNDEIAQMVRDHPGSFVGLATLPLQDTRLAMDELERAMSLGLSGLAIGTHVDGRDLDDPRLRPVFKLASDYGAFMLCHPHNPRAGTALDGFYLGNVIGNPLETTIAFCRLVLGGVLDEAPDLRLCFSHGGGYIAAAIGRLDHAYAVRPETTGSRRRPSDYLRSVYFDSLTHDPRGLADLVDRVGADRVLVGSDYPADMGAKRPTEVVRLAGLAPEDEHSVLQGNAARLFPGIVSSDSATVH